MIKETYCSYEVAKLLKEKGFHEPCIATYNSTTKNFQIEEIYEDWTIHWKGCISAPTLQMTMKWLREIYGLDIVIEISDPSVNDRKYYCVIWDKNNDSYILDLFDSYEDAVEAAIKYCLENLI